MRRLFVILLTAFFVIPSHADSTSATERLALGRQLVELMGYRESSERTGYACSHPEGSSFDPKKLVEANPNALGGITPKSAYWPRMEAVFKTYRLNLCLFMSADSIFEFMAGKFADRLSGQELRAAITFYSSLEGRSLRHVLIEQTQEAMTRIEAGSNANSPAYKEYSTGLQNIINDFQKNPK